MRRGGRTVTRPAHPQKAGQWLVASSRSAGAAAQETVSPEGMGLPAAPSPGRPTGRGNGGGGEEEVDQELEGKAGK